MEDAAALLKTVTSEVAESKAVLQKLGEEVMDLSEIIGPALIQQIKDLRTSRMAVVSEVHQMLGALRDIRRFFLESEYAVEMGRLERLVSVCRDLPGAQGDRRARRGLRLGTPTRRSAGVGLGRASHILIGARASAGAS